MSARPAAAQFLIVLTMMLAFQGTARLAHASKENLLILEEVKLSDATLEDAVAYLKAALRNLGMFDDPNVNVVILGTPKAGARVNLDLREVPARVAFEHVARITGMKMRVDDHAVVLVPLDWPEPIRTRVYRVPPDFISTGSAAK